MEAAGPGFSAARQLFELDPELAEIVQDEQFRTELRDFFHRAFGTERGKLMATRRCWPTPSDAGFSSWMRKRLSRPACRRTPRRLGTSPNGWLPSTGTGRRSRERE